MNEKLILVILFIVMLSFWFFPETIMSQHYDSEEPWSVSMYNMRAEFQELNESSQTRERAESEWNNFRDKYPIEWDWMIQDDRWSGIEWMRASDEEAAELIRDLINNIIDPNNDDYGYYKEKINSTDDLLVLLETYKEIRKAIRVEFIAPLLEKNDEIVFAKHFDMGGSHYAYTEAVSDGREERHFNPGTELNILKLDEMYGEEIVLIEDSGGVIRNPDVSYDGENILFSWKKSNRNDDYHIYELNTETEETRQLTEGLGYADYEAQYLPNDDIVFNSTRAVQTVDCWVVEVSNLYLMNKDGNYMRRIGFDQVHTNFPTVMEDGRIIYTRWDYNDRGQIFPQGLFQMNPDGSSQTEFYANNSWFPTTVIHARNIPGTEKVLGIFTGHHSRQAGKLGVIDPARGRQENMGAQLIAPIRETPAEHIDGYGQSGDLFQYPYPVTEDKFLVSYSPGGWDDNPFGIYFMDINGNRELLIRDHEISSNQPVPLSARERSQIIPSMLNWTSETGTYYMQDIYHGPGLTGIERGEVDKLRVIALEYRPTAIGVNTHPGPAGYGHSFTPASVGSGSWDVKNIIGDVNVHEDGSALFEVPARTPLYFQALNEKGEAIQSMRSWSTLMPGEFFSCVGCHENKNEAPPVMEKDGGFAIAMEEGVQQPEQFYDVEGGFSYGEIIQPILDENCIQCHNDRDQSPPSNPGGRMDVSEDNATVFSLLSDTTDDRAAGRAWSDSYLNLTRSVRIDDGLAPDSFRAQHTDVVNWINSQSVPEMIPPYSAGAATSELMNMLREGHGGVELTVEELHKIAAWIDLLIPYVGNYKEANIWSKNDMDWYNYQLEKRLEMEELDQQNIEEFINK